MAMADEVIDSELALKLIGVWVVDVDEMVQAPPFNQIEDADELAGFKEMFKTLKIVVTKDEMIAYTGDAPEKSKYKVLSAAKGEVVLNVTDEDGTVKKLSFKIDGDKVVAKEIGEDAEDFTIYLRRAQGKEAELPAENKGGDDEGGMGE